MAKTVYWSYKGYTGDSFFLHPERLVDRFFPNSKSSEPTVFDWLNQRGFGPGYYNSSGVYICFQKTVVQDDFVLPKHHDLVIYEGFQAFKKARAEFKAHAKRANKNNPY